MGARPSSFRKGGGFLNGVIATIVGYEFSDEFNGKPFEPGRDPVTKKEKFHSLFGKLVVRADDATEDTVTTLFVGGYDDFTVSPDGQVLTKGDIGRNTAWGILITSMCENGFPETRFPESDTESDFRAIIGTRCKFVQKDNEEATKKLGKRKDPKSGREYKRQDLVVSEVLDLPKEGATAGASAGAGEAFDVAETGELTLQKILKGKGVKSKKRVGTMILSELADHPKRDEIYQWLYDDKNLEAMMRDDIIVFDKAAGTIALPSEAAKTA